ncbi:MAG: hypothetical protein ABSG25_14355 [Bryobacteraceae bacterium]
MRLLIGLTIALGCLAQAQTITVPTGTKIPLTLISPLRTWTAHPGDSVRAVTAFPTTVDDRVAIPAGTGVEGVIDKIRRRGRHAGFEMHFTRLIFINGYTAPLSGSTTMERTASLGRPSPTQAEADEMASTFPSPAARGFETPMVGGFESTAANKFASPTADEFGSSMTSGVQAFSALPGSSFPTTPTLTAPPRLGPSPALIGGLMAAGAAALIILGVTYGGRGLFLDAGSPLDLVLGEPLSLDAAKLPFAPVAGAN